MYICGAMRYFNLLHFNMIGRLRSSITKSFRILFVKVPTELQSAGTRNGYSEPLNSGALGQSSITPCQEPSTQI